MMARIPTIRATGRPDSAGVPVPVSLLLELAAVVEANGLSTSRISSVGGLPFSSRFEDEVVLGVGVGTGVAAVLLVALVAGIVLQSNAWDIGYSIRTGNVESNMAEARQTMDALLEEGEYGRFYGYYDANDIFLGSIGAAAKHLIR